MVFEVKNSREVRARSKEGKRGLKVVGAAAAQCRASSRARRSTEPCKNGRLYFGNYSHSKGVSRFARPFFENFNNFFIPANSDYSIYRRSKTVHFQEVELSKC